MESQKMKPFHAVQSVALDPRYGSRKTREIATGGLAGQLLLSSKARLIKRLARPHTWGAASAARSAVPCWLRLSCMHGSLKYA
jgi:hypothetical protein